MAVFAEQLHDGGAVLGVVQSRYIPARFVDHEVFRWLGAVEQLAVHADVVARGVGAGTELGDDLSVDDDAAFEDDGLGGAAGGDAGVSENFLETVAGEGCGLGLGGGLHLFIIACLSPMTIKLPWMDTWPGSQAAASRKRCSILASRSCATFSASGLP